MKKNFLIALTAIFVLGLAMAVYAFNRTNDLGKTSASCCAKSDACPMKSHNMQTAENHSTASCCDMEDCCCKNGSCPMKKQGENVSDNCCSNCCGEACPMKDKQAQAVRVEAQNVNVSNGETCEKKHS